MSDGLLIGAAAPVDRETQGRPHADFEIETHGNLELYVKAVARTFGWDAEVGNLDVDPFETQERGYTVRDPGRGDVTLTQGNQATCFEYHLPEFARHLFADVEASIKGHEMDRARRLGKSGPLIIGG